MTFQNESLESLNKKIEGAESLQTIVKTMKLFSLVNIYQFEHAVESLKDYFRTVVMGLDALLHQSPDHIYFKKKKMSGSVAIVIFGSNQGLCGKFNEQIITRACSEMDLLKIENKRRKFLTVGLRVKDHLENLNIKPQHTLSAPTSIHSINKEARQLLEILENWQTSEEIHHMYLVYQKRISKTTCTPHIHHFLPISIHTIKQKQPDWTWKTIPWHRQTRSELIKDIIHQYIFVSLYQAYAESLASENSARLATMQNAEQSIKEHLENLQMSFSQKRQSSITEELLDVVAGYETTMPSRELINKNFNKTLK